MTDTPISREQAIEALENLLPVQHLEGIDWFVVVNRESALQVINRLLPLNSLREPLDRETLDALIDGLDLMRDPSNAANVHGHIGALLLRDAILESLSQEDGDANES